jgi:hypothetical protein
VEASNQRITVKHIYCNKNQEEKKKLIGQECESVRNNLRCNYQTDQGSMADEKSEEQGNR